MRSTRKRRRFRRKRSTKKFRRKRKKGGTKRRKKKKKKSKKDAEDECCKNACGLSAATAKKRFTIYGTGGPMADCWEKLRTKYYNDTLNKKEKAVYDFALETTLAFFSDGDDED